MSSVKDSHNQAMDAAFFAARERRRGNGEKAAELFKQALQHELDAIAGMSEADGMSWAVLHRSAGWLALDCNRPRLAEQLACRALAGEPHPEITEELRDLLEHANLHQYLEPQGIVLGTAEVQLTLTGHAVANGIALMSDVVSRMNNFQSLVYRIAQRMLEKPYQGRIPNDIRNRYRAFAAPPRSGSFAISLRIGEPSPQLSLPGFFSSEEIIHEFMDLMELANSVKIDEIQERIPNSEYQRNFLGLAKTLAPDGDRIRQVGFVVGGEATRTLSVTTPASRFPLPDNGERNQPGVSVREVSGTLRYADAGAGASNRNRIKLINDNGPTHAINVPAGMMDDIVRPLWNSFVTVRGSMSGRQKIFRLQEIWESEPASGSALSQPISMFAKKGGGQQPPMIPYP